MCLRVDIIGCIFLEVGYLMTLLALKIYGVDDRIIRVNEYGAVGGIKPSTGERSTRRKSAPVPPKTPHDVSRD
jgi:hypothetical protein